MLVCLILLCCLSYVSTQKMCTDGRVELVDCYIEGTGKVMICVDGVWRNICGKSWGPSEANVTCRQLGYNISAPVTTDHYRKDLLNYLTFNCSKDQNQLIDCQRSNESYCRFSAAAICKNREECNDTDVRLVDGESDADGKVEVCINGMWGSVCDDGWNHRDASVVCRQLGFDGTSIPLLKHGVLSNTSSLYYFLDNMDCNGNEETLSECKHNGLYQHNCVENHHEAGVLCHNYTLHECNESSVRLVDGYLSDSGRVEVCIDGIWGSVCDDKWDNIDASVVCRQLGYDGASIALMKHRVKTESLLYHVDNVGCDGTEELLTECKHDGLGIHNCHLNYEEAGVRCLNRCNERDIHLIGGATLLDGIVEICQNGKWNAVCSDGDKLAKMNAVVACHQLRYYGESYPLTMSASIPESTLFLACNKETFTHNETVTQLLTCNSASNSSCSSLIKVLCTDTTGCIEGSIRLVGSDDISRGRLEYCYNSVWYSVCAEDWDPSGQEVRTVCNHLGYYQRVPVLINYGRGSNLNQVDIQCSSRSFSDCLVTPRNTSIHCGLMAGIDCIAPCSTHDIRDCHDCPHCTLRPPYSPISCTCHYECFKSGDCCSDITSMNNCFMGDCELGDVRFMNGLTNSTGRLEFCVNGLWGGVCDYDNVWGPENAGVVCHQLGFSPENAIVLDYEPRFGSNSNDPVIGGVDCIGNEDNLLQCYHTTIGRHNCKPNSTSLEIIISCYDEERGCTEGDVRLYGGVDVTDGRVEFCKDRRWGAVCNDRWNINSATVVCTQMKFDSKGVELLDKTISTKESPDFNMEITCEGNEMTLGDCKQDMIGTETCRNAVVSCNKNQHKTGCDDTNKSKSLKTKDLSRALSIYGECSLYDSEAEICNGILDKDMRVYIIRGMGGQKVLSQLLNEKLNSARDILTSHSEHCRDTVFRLFCHFYFPPCGNSTHLAPPTSICPEDCSSVEQNCPDTMRIIHLAFEGLRHKLRNCNGTSNILDPLPHCCIGSQQVSTSTPSSNAQDIPVMWMVVGVAIGLILISAEVLVSYCLFVLYSKRQKKKRIYQMQRDILAIRGNDAQERNINLAANGKAKSALELKPAKSGTNAYSDPKPAESFNILQVPGHSIARIQSWYMRELTRGNFLVSSEEVTLLQCIGEGEFGIVYKARLRSSSNAEVAVKTLKGQFNQVEVDRIVEESLKMSHFKHSHVMSLIGVCLDSGSAPYIIMPYMANGSLLKYLRRDRNNIVIINDTDEDEVKEVCKRLMVMCSQIASGMEYLAAEKYVHRDLAARNCMIDAHFLIKITDFGLSEDVYERNYFRQESTSGEVVRLPIKWMAPESLSDGHFSEKSDVWSYGVTMWEIFSGGKAPYPGTDPLTLMSSLEKGHRMPQPYNSACNEEIYSMMRQCWEISPEDRPSFKEICSTVSQYIECIAGYLEIGYNPFIFSGTKKNEVLETRNDKEDVLDGVQK